MDETVSGGYERGEMNKRGERLAEWAAAHKLITGNTCFQQDPRS